MTKKSTATPSKPVPFRPVGNRILVRKIDAGAHTASGIYVGKVEGVDKAEVMVIGNLVINCVVGDTIMVDWTKAGPVDLNRETFYIVNDSSVVGIFDESYSDPVINLI